MPFPPRPVQLRCFVQTRRFTAAVHHSNSRQPPLRPREPPSGSKEPKRKAVRWKVTPQPSIEKNGHSEPLKSSNAGPACTLGRTQDARHQYPWYFRAWLFVCTAWVAYFAGKMAEGYETVPISGRTKCTGPHEFRAAIEKSFKEARDQLQKRMEPTPGLMDPAHEPEAAHLMDRIRNVLDKVAYAAGQESCRWEVQVTSDARPTGSLSGYGDLRISKGAMNIAPSDSHLAWLLAHEVAHRLAGHHQERHRSISSMITMALPIVLPGIALIGLGMFRSQSMLRRTSTRLTLSPIVLGPMYYAMDSRAQEYEADEMGLYLAAAAGYDIEAAPCFLELMWRHYKTELKFYDLLSSIDPLPSHPSFPKRLQRMRDLIPTVRAVVEKHDMNNCHASSIESISKEAGKRWAEFVRGRDQRRATAAEERLRPVDAFE